MGTGLSPSINPPQKAEVWFMRLWLILASLLFFAPGCIFVTPVPLDQERINEISSRNGYIALVKSFMSHDEIYYFNQAGESLLLDAVNVSPELVSAATVRWTEDKEFMEEFGKWFPKERGRVVLLGVYNRTFKKDDFLKNGSYRAKLLTGGKSYEPVYMAEVKPAFLEKYFPVFNHWAKVFALRFPPEAGYLESSILVEWPAGTRELPLISKADSSPSPK
jgi:hypothetical protein